MSDSSEAKLFDSSGLNEDHEEEKKTPLNPEPTQPPLNFPTDQWNTLNNCLSMTKWLVPVLPDSQLETLIKATIELAKHGRDNECECCKHFIRYGLLNSFQKTFQDEAVDGWDCQILHFIYMNALLAVELCAIKASDDSLPILDLEGVIFDPESRFQIHSIHPVNLCWKIQHGQKSNGAIRYTHITPLLPHLLKKTPDEQLDLPADHPPLREFVYRNPSKRSLPILTDLVNLFGRLGGFDRLKERFTRPGALDTLRLSLVNAYLYPFSLCCEYLHPDVVKEYFIPIMDIVVPHIIGMDEMRMRQEAKNEIKPDSLVQLHYCFRSFLIHMPAHQDKFAKINMLCLNLILRFLQYAPFSGRMTALNELNRLFSRLTPSSLDVQGVNSYQLTTEQVGRWMEEQQVLSLVLRENLHQPQYVEKVERIIRFMIKHGYLTAGDLDRIWEAQDGKHEAIVKNVFDMLAKLALEFTPEQLDHLFVLFQQSWEHATERQRERLIDLICRLAEEDSDGLMAQKVLNLLWGLAVNPGSSYDITDSALKAHAKILDHNISEVGAQNRMQWLIKMIGIMAEGPRSPLLMPAIKQFTEICNLIPVQQYSQKPPYGLCRTRMKEIERLDSSYHLLDSAVKNVTDCMAFIRQERSKNQGTTSSSDQPEEKPVHLSVSVEVKELLQLIRYLLLEGGFSLPIDLMQQIWMGMMGSSTPDVAGTESAEDQATEEEREACFEWFSLLPTNTIRSKEFRIFFDDNILRVNPAHLTPAGMKLFQHFFFHINLNHGLLLADSLSIDVAPQFRYLMDNSDLHGLDHVWRMLLDAPDAVAVRAMELLQQLYTNLGPHLIPNRKELNEDFLQHCFTRLKADHDTVRCLLDTKGSSPPHASSKPDLERTLSRMIRVIQLLHHFITREDPPNPGESHLQKAPLKRAWIGSSFMLTVTFYSPSSETRSPARDDCDYPNKLTNPVPGNAGPSYLHASDTVLFPVHANMTIGEIRAQLLAIRLPLLLSSSAVHPTSCQDGRAPSNSDYDYDSHVVENQFRRSLKNLTWGPPNYKLELYIPQTKDNSTSSALNPGFFGTPIDFSSDSELFVSLLPLFPDWPAAFLDDRIGHRQNLGRYEEPSARLSITANPVLATPQLSYEFKGSGPKTILRKSSSESPTAHTNVIQSGKLSLDAPPPLSPTPDSPSPTEDTSCAPPYAECPPEVDSMLSSDVFNSIRSSGSNKPSVSDQRSQFLLQLAKLAIEVNNTDLFSNVLGVLFCLPAPDTMIERLRMDVTSAALIAQRDNSKQDLQDWVTVQGVDTMALRGSALGELLTSVARLASNDPASQKSSRLVDLYYTLQVLYSLCLPSAAVNQCHDLYATGSTDSRALLLQGNLSKVPLWCKASQFTFQLLRAGGIPLLLSCPLLRITTTTEDNQCSSVHGAVTQMVCLWIVRILRLLLAVVSFVLITLHREAEIRRQSNIKSSTLPLLSPTPPSPEPGSVDLFRRIAPLCESLNSLSRLNSPVAGGNFFISKHADWTSRMAISKGVTESEVEHQWLSDTDYGVDNLLLLIGQSAADLSAPWTSQMTNSERKGSDDQTKGQRGGDGDLAPGCSTDTGHKSRTSNSETSSFSPRHGENTYDSDRSYDSGNLALSSPSRDSELDSPGRERKKKNTEVGNLQRQILQALRSGDAPGMVAMEALACLPFCVALFPNCKFNSALCGLSDPKSPTNWSRIVQDLIYSRSELLRYAAVYNLFEVTTLSSVPASDLPAPSPGELPRIWTVNPTLYLVRLLFTFLTTHVSRYLPHSDQYFSLLSLLLQHVYTHRIPFKESSQLLLQEIEWLRKTIAYRRTQENSFIPTELSSSDLDTHCSPSSGATHQNEQHLSVRESLDLLLCGHMRVCSALLALHRPESRSPSEWTGPRPNSSPSPERRSSSAPVIRNDYNKLYFAPLIQDLVQSLLFPAREHNDLTPMVDRSGSSPDNLLSAVFDLLCALAKHNPSAVHLISTLLCQLCFPDDFQLSAYPWNHSPPAMCSNAQPGGSSHFVGLRNGGATCYMNAILQQLFSLIPIRYAVLSARPELRLARPDVRVEKRTEALLTSMQTSGIDLTDPLPVLKTEPKTTPDNSNEDETPSKKEESKKLTTEQTHQLRLLFHTQTIFGHLTYSFLQSYMPTEFWQEFKFSSEQVNIREQHDALEFLQTLGNDLDEALHLCGMRKTIEQVLGGTYADQKLCIDCPHQYSRNEPFTTLNVDIRNHQNLLQSLDQYVKGDRLEGDNAYWCEACKKKVTTLKRMCINRLPAILAIQLKRFDYDWDRNVAIKFNDYFEFPRELDMFPYTVEGLSNQVPKSDASSNEKGESARVNKESSAAPGSGDQEESKNAYTKYTLRGVVVHSGQASAGHYYSFIRQYCPQTRSYRWYKYDDNEVSLSRMDDENEAKSQWFGGEPTDDPYDLSKISYSWNSKRWWNAYILFYEREDFQNHIVSDPALTNEVSVTPRLKKLIHRENVEYLHQQMQFHPLLASFVANLTQITLELCKFAPNSSEELSLAVLRLLTNFSFAVRFQHVSRDWELWIPLFFRLVSLYPRTRQKFVQWTFFSSPDRIPELLFECPFPEVRFMFAVLIVYISQASASDPCQSSTDCLNAFRKIVDDYGVRSPTSTNTKADHAAAARAESAKEILKSFVCTNVPASPDRTNPTCWQPNLGDCLIQLIILQLQLSPGEFLKRTSTSSEKSHPSADYYSESGHHSSGKATPSSSYSKSGRYGSHHPLIWSQYFSIFWDYANVDENSCRRLLRLGLPERLVSYALNNQGALSSTASFGLATYGSGISTGSQKPDVLRLKFERIFHSLSNTVPTPTSGITSSALRPPILPPISACLDSVILSMTSSSSHSGMYAYGTSLGSVNTPSALAVQYAGINTLWGLLSLLICSLDVSAYCNDGMDEPEQTPSIQGEEAAQETHSIGDSPAPIANRPSNEKRLLVTSPNPYATYARPLCVISSILASTIFRTTASRFMPCFLKPVSSAIFERITNVILFLCYENVRFSNIILEALIWAIKNSQGDGNLALSLLHSVLVIPDAYKFKRLEHTLEDADPTGVSNSLVSNQYHQPFIQHTKIVKLIMDLIFSDPDVQQFFRADESHIHWLRRWIMAVAGDLQATSSQSYWYTHGVRPTQTQDDFIETAQRIYEILPIPDEDQNPSSVDSEGIEDEEDDADGYPSDGSHYEEPLDHDVEGQLDCQYLYGSPESEQQPEQRSQQQTYLRKPPVGSLSEVTQSPKCAPPPYKNEPQRRQPSPSP
ncbi:unnamed protein product [Calicophoron daubneyi]|uniref:ubiquitinyl hydrolase 1 n=1 Tax=Calicophoron daubneyi TaxID=300641 RepID=A0AAV2TWM9_CALDB